MRSFTPYYSLLIFTTLLCVIAGSSAIHLLTGQGQGVLLFGLGTGVGMTWSCYVGIENWRLTMATLDDIASSVSALCLVLGPKHRYIHPKIALGLATPPLSTSAEFQLEIEVRSLLDAVALLGQAVVIDGLCHCCNTSDGHSVNCAYLKSMQLYEAGCEKRVGWAQFERHAKKADWKNKSKVRANL